MPHSPRKISWAWNINSLSVSSLGSIPQHLIYLITSPPSPKHNLSHHFAMRAQLVFALAITLALSSFVAADFRYGIAQCEEAGGGYFEGGFILPADSPSLCLAAYAADKPGANIPVDSTHPNAVICGHNVTIGFESLVWFSTDGDSGNCVRTNAEPVTCYPPYAECTYTDLLSCSSSYCEES
ncbi:hypothetical protein DL93DRAFT_2071800 [Clavulina sp. PMI_390]|nr:hypothetical protein DL93DRAFT_2071800 [Clavulina sp. PMI_390]